MTEENRRMPLLTTRVASSLWFLGMGIVFLAGSLAFAQQSNLDAQQSTLAAANPVGVDGEKLQKDFYRQKIQPLLNKHCVQCHGTGRHSSDYRVDTFTGLMTAGDLGEDPVIPFKVDDSVLIEYVSLDESEDFAMPPIGRPRLSADEIELLKKWVEQGAKGPVVNEAEQAEKAELQKLGESGLIVLPVSRESENLYVDFQNVKETLSAEDFGRLAGFKDRIEELKINHSVANEQLEMLRGASELRVLDLTGRESVDGLIDLINSFQTLQRLLLFGSDLSDSGLEKLSVPASGLLYIGSTKVTPEQFDAFQKSHANVGVFGDVDLEAVDAIEESDIVKELIPALKEKK